VTGPHSIRVATADDLETAMALRSDCIAAMRAAGIEQWDDVYPNRETLAADIRDGAMHLAIGPDGAVAGLIVLNELQNPEYDGVPWTEHSSRIIIIHRLMVAPAVQQRGIARALMAFAEQRSASLGYEVARLDAFTRNPRALRLYETLGYRDVGGITLRKGAFRCFEKRIANRDARH
jgi:ribosomal protein S18 acetylase RimI-like enzyme